MGITSMKRAKILKSRVSAIFDITYLFRPNSYRPRCLQYLIWIQPKSLVHDQDQSKPGKCYRGISHLVPLLDHYKAYEHPPLDDLSAYKIFTISVRP
jgi:hypothetical protein